MTRNLVAAAVQLVLAKKSASNACWGSHLSLPLSLGSDSLPSKGSGKQRGSSGHALCLSARAPPEFVSNLQLLLVGPLSHTLSSSRKSVRTFDHDLIFISPTSIMTSSMCEAFFHMGPGDFECIHV